MKPWNLLSPAALLASFSACAAPPAYFGSGARVALENGAAYWEAPALAPGYLSARMRRRRGASGGEKAVYDGALALHSISPAVLRSTFTLAEGSSATFHYELNARVARPGALRYEPGALDVVVSCAHGACRADSKPLPIAADGGIELRAGPFACPPLTTCP